MSAPDQNAGSGSAADIDTVRQALRQDCLRQRAALGTSTHAALSMALCAELSRTLAAQPTATLGFCIPFRDEPDISPLMPVLAAAGWQLCVPVVEQANNPMRFRAWFPDVQTTHDRHGIVIPVAPVVHAPAVLVIPVVAIDPDGYRLGYGGGYFDRTLASLAASGVRPVCIGIGFERAMVTSIHPQAHDQPLDLFVSEAGTRRFYRSGANAP